MGMDTKQAVLGFQGSSWKKDFLVVFVVFFLSYSSPPPPHRQ